MSDEKDFDFKVREELKKRFEYKILRSNLLDAMHETETGEKVTGDMLIDMITFCSKGDLDLAIRGLQESERMVSRCWFFLRSYNNHFRIGRATELLIEIWRLGFIKSKCVLDWNENLGEQHLPSHRVLEQQIATMNAITNQVNVSPSEKLTWVNDTIFHYDHECFLANRLWKNKKKIFDNAGKK